VENEDPSRPLSDARIARQLNRVGIRIARRTVAKYREELNLPSSEQRRRALR
jgi:RNA polymerase sigma-54 factor